MRITESRITETCLDGTVNVEKRLDRPMDRKFIYHLAELGDLEYFSEFARPFFRITRSGSFVIKGVEGAETFQVFFIRSAPDHEAEIETRITRYPA